MSRSAAVCLLFLAVACQGVVDDEEDVEAGADLQVSLEIREGPGDGTLAFVPVFIHDQGPFTFALDTGASHSVIDEGVAAELGLEDGDGVAAVTGVVGAAGATPVRVEAWQMGDVDLGGRRLLALDLGGPEGVVGLQGLLGSDVLSEFGAITVDYDAGVVILRPRNTSP